MKVTFRVSIELLKLRTRNLECIPLRSVLHRLCDGIEKTEQISRFKSSNLLLPNLRDSILAQVAFEEFLGNMSEFRVSKMIDPLLVGKTVDSVFQGALSITLTPTHEKTRFIAPVK